MESYGIMKTDGSFLKGMSHEEAFAYMECDSEPGDKVIRRDGDIWWKIEDGQAVVEEKKS